MCGFELLSSVLLFQPEGRTPFNISYRADLLEMNSQFLFFWKFLNFTLALSLQPVEGGGTWSYGHKKMNSAKNLNELGSELFPSQAPEENAAQLTP